MSYSPDLQIKEPLLEKYHNLVIQCLMENDIPYEAEYSFEPNPSLNSIVSYTIEINDTARSGLIVVSKGKFGGVICKTEKLNYLEKEGFSEDQIFDEPIFATAPCVMSFICMLALPIIKDLEFTEALLVEFRRQVKEAKAGNKKSKPKKGGA